VTRRPRPKRAPVPRRAPAKSHLTSPLTPALLSSLVEDSSDAIALLDRSGTTLYTNQTATRVLGYPVQELIGRSALDLVHPDDTTGARHLCAQLLAQPGVPLTAQVRCRTRDGSYRLLEAVGINRLDDPAVGAIIASYRDIAERHERELRYQVLV
jgi:PAS domain S-box-containing protein